MDKEDEEYVCVYTHMMEYHSAIIKNKIMPFATTWMDMKIIKLSQTEKYEYYMLTLICRI